MPTIHVDGQTHEIGEGKNLLEACLELGYDLPYFCWHPALGSVGACRQCAVRLYKDEDDDQGMLAMSCMSPATDGVRLSIADAEASDMRGRVVEWLMANHPHDCPVCEEGGECHLQDMTVMTGHTYRRFRFRKRTHRNQYLGPFINHEMNRCIACYRCVRFYQEYAGGLDLAAQAMHHHVYFGRHEEGTLENEFSGNLVEVCPTGVFTDKPLSDSYTRKWDLRAAPSICLHCGVGCNTSPGERYGRVKRVQNRYHHDINGYFLCDRGRFGHGFVYDAARLDAPRLVDGEGTPRTIGADEALERLRAMVAEAPAVGIGSPRASLETNHALRQLVGAENFSTGMSAADQRLVARILQIAQHGPVRVPTLTEMEQADAVLVLGEDVTNTAPRIALALRQAARTQAKAGVESLGVQAWKDKAVHETMPWTRTPFHLLSPTATRLDDVATGVRHGAPDDLARLGYAVAQGIAPSRPEVAGLDREARAWAEAIAQDLRDAQRPLIVSGCGAASGAVIEAAADVAAALAGEGKKVGLCLTVPEANSLGTALMGGLDVESALERVERGQAETLIVAENDLYRRCEPERVDAALAQARHVVCVDALEHATVAQAELTLPAGTFAEADGTVVNYEGRAQRFFQVYPPEADIREAWRWLEQARTGVSPRLDDLIASLAEAVPALAGITEAAPDADYRIAGMKIAREPHRYSGRTAMHAHVDVSEPKPASDPDSPLSFTMEGYNTGTRRAAAITPFFWAPRWNSPQAVGKFQAEINGELVGGDSGVRLLAGAGHDGSTVGAPPPAFEAVEGRWLLVPLHHIFGSEDLSARSPPVAERVPPPYVALHPGDAERLGLGEGAEAGLIVDRREYRLPVRRDAELAVGTAGVPRGLPGAPPVLPAYGTFREVRS
ncbi:MAG: NADH-quinone oxidoreductase subunit NuoG [Halofilum sp. (in: g-proteobacteria)]